MLSLNYGWRLGRQKERETVWEERCAPGSRSRDAVWEQGYDPSDWGKAQVGRSDR